MMLPWVERPTITLDIAVPMPERLTGIPSQAIADGRALLDSVLSMMPRSARFLSDLVRLRTLGRFQAEANHIARKVGVSWRDVMIANLSYDLVLATIGCSTIALPTPSGPVVARNMDWWPEEVLARSSYLLRMIRNGELVFANAGWPGTIGVVTGLSGRGFAVVLNAVLGPERRSVFGYPVLLFLRRIVEEASDFEVALDRLTHQRLTTPALITLVGSDNRQRVVIERSPTRAALRWASGDEPLVATNDYRLLFSPTSSDQSEIYRTTCSRYDALCQFFAHHRAEHELQDETLLYFLTDPRVEQTITAQHIILRPRQKSVRLFVPRRLLTQEFSNSAATQSRPTPR